MSNAATDGSTLRTSPAEPAGSGGSESGGSGVESIGAVSERSSSTFGDPSMARVVAGAVEEAVCGPQPGTSKAPDMPSQTETESTTTQLDVDDSLENETKDKLNILRCTILENMVDRLGKLDGVSGLQAIPYMQVVHLLIMDLDNNELGRRVMDKMLTAFIQKLEMVSPSPASEVNSSLQNNM